MPEAWTRAAWALLALLAAATLYLGVRPGGIGPLLVYRHGPWILFLGAIGVLGGAAVTAVRRRPVLARERLSPLAAVLLVFGAATYPLPYPSSREGRPSAVVFRLPVEGEWTVLWGGEDRDANRLARFFADRRWALHLVVAAEGAAGTAVRSHGGDGRELADYPAYDRVVRAPAAGRVVRVRDGIPDAPPRTGGGDGLGNLVVLEVAEGEHLFVANLRAGTIAVAEGERVEARAPIGRVGNSAGSAITPEPHVAIHLQTTPEPLRGEAIPWRFTDYRADGRRVEADVPRGGLGAHGELLGQRVEDVSASPSGPATETERKAREDGAEVPRGTR